MDYTRQIDPSTGTTRVTEISLKQGMSGRKYLMNSPLMYIFMTPEDYIVLILAKASLLHPQFRADET
jgi:hypothetical protein